VNLELMSCDIFIKFFFFGFHGFIFETFLDQLTDENLLFVEQMFGLDD